MVLAVVEPFFFPFLFYPNIIRHDMYYINTCVLSSLIIPESLLMPGDGRQSHGLLARETKARVRGPAHFHMRRRGRPLLALDYIRSIVI
jgi:hypothetical protein